MAAGAYDRFMGRFAFPLAVAHISSLDLGGVDRALDVGCGTGAVTTRLVAALGEGRVAAVDPSSPFVASTRARFPGADVRRGSAESLPFADDSFDLTVAQLVVPFMADPVRGLAEMIRVTRPGGIVSASVWDHGGERSPLAPFWRAVGESDPAAHDESGQFGAHDGELADLFERSGLIEVTRRTLSATVGLAGPADYWEPFTLGVGPAGAYLAGLDETDAEALRARCLAELPPGPFALDVAAWAATGRVRPTASP